MSLGVGESVLKVQVAVPLVVRGELHEPDSAGSAPGLKQPASRCGRWAAGRRCQLAQEEGCVCYWGGGFDYNHVEERPI